MIPFDANIGMYGFGIFITIAAIAMFILGVYLYIAKTDFTRPCLAFAFLLLFLSFVSFVPYVIGTSSSKTITICNHQIDPKYVGGVIIMDENGNTYDVYNTNIQMRIRDGIKTNVEIASPFGYKSFIYKSDLPAICGNQTCGGVPT